MKYKTVIFDLDGTLLNTLEDLADAMNMVLQASGYPTHRLDAYKYFIGNGVGCLVERALPENCRDEGDMTKYIASFKKEYSGRWDSKTAPYSGVCELLRRLLEQRVRTAVLSNKPHEYVVKCVDKFFEAGQFEFVQGVDEKVLPKPDLSGALKIVEKFCVEPAEVIYVGDTGVDMKTAVDAGFFAVGVTWGFRTPDELLQHGAQVLLAKPDELLALCR